MHFQDCAMLPNLPKLKFKSTCFHLHSVAGSQVLKQCPCSTSDQVEINYAALKGLGIKICFCILRHISVLWLLNRILSTSLLPDDRERSCSLAMCFDSMCVIPAFMQILHISDFFPLAVLIIKQPQVKINSWPYIVPSRKCFACCQEQILGVQFLHLIDFHRPKPSSSEWTGTSVNFGLDNRCEFQIWCILGLRHKATEGYLVPSDKGLTLLFEHMHNALIKHFSFKADRSRVALLFDFCLAGWGTASSFLCQSVCSPCKPQTPEKFLQT